MGPNRWLRTKTRLKTRLRASRERPMCAKKLAERDLLLEVRKNRNRCEHCFASRRPADARERAESFRTVCGSSRELFESKSTIGLLDLSVPSIRLSASSSPLSIEGGLERGTNRSRTEVVEGVRTLSPCILHRDHPQRPSKTCNSLARQQVREDARRRGDLAQLGWRAPSREVRLAAGRPDALVFMCRRPPARQILMAAGKSRGFLRVTS